jgi:hypothetical protein
VRFNAVAYWVIQSRRFIDRFKVIALLENSRSSIYWEIEGHRFTGKFKVVALLGE